MSPPTYGKSAHLDRPDLCKTAMLVKFAPSADTFRHKINQEDVEERAQQVSVMKHIFNHSKQVVVWLGEEADNSSNLCEYAKKMRPRDGLRASLSRILTPRQLEISIQKLLERPWFQRVWVCMLRVNCQDEHGNGSVYVRR